MKYLLDTNICIYIIRNRPADVLKRFRRLLPGAAGISVVTYFELKYGALRSQAPTKNEALIEQFTLPLEIVALDLPMADECAKLRLELKHEPIGPMDLLIAGQARSLGAVLVTNNVREFSHVKGLSVENWVLTRVRGRG